VCSLQQLLLDMGSTNCMLNSTHSSSLCGMAKQVQAFRPTDTHSIRIVTKQKSDLSNATYVTHEHGTTIYWHRFLILNKIVQLAQKLESEIMDQVLSFTIMSHWLKKEYRQRWFGQTKCKDDDVLIEHCMDRDEI